MDINRRSFLKKTSRSLAFGVAGQALLRPIAAVAQAATGLSEHRRPIETAFFVGIRSRIPVSIWGALYFVTILAMAGMGYHAGLTGKSRSLISIALVLTFSGVIWLIADIDRPQEGLLQVSQQAMVDLRNTMGEPKP